ncbi:sensor histidine kinase [Virgibacillus oceani]|uniref:histidine kinase n=1 Tax=Virgibacillus oceani TaxID=1479511 RepID=A0A917M268_9BACI|nr:sensor histidine kinase [Virgibacillus oceani]GGG74457.1 two-component sensor histidine kinase [Virgibacillus oceani]
MKNNSARTISVILYISLFVAFLFLYKNNPDSQGVIAAFTASFILLQIIRYSILPIASIPMKSTAAAIILSIQFLLAFAIQIIDGSFVPQINFFILLAEAAFYYRLAISVPFTFLCYAAFALGVYINLDFPPFDVVSFVIPRMLEYWLIFGFSYMARRSQQQSQELEMAYQHLQIINTELEEKTLIEERVRLSREIHDTVGHTLTTTLVGLESSKQLHANGQIDKALDKLDIVQEQVKRSLRDIRKSSRTLHDNPLFINFKNRLEDLLKSTSQQSDITITKNISDIQKLRPDQELAIYRSLQEGLTNGIKHGKATQFHFSLKELDGRILFKLSDDGTTAAKEMEYGFGLTAMNERITAIGGRMEIWTEPENGCSLSISIPIANKGFQSMEVPS